MIHFSFSFLLSFSFFFFYWSLFLSQSKCYLIIVSLSIHILFPMFLWLCGVELMIIDSYLPKWEWLVMDIYSCNDYNIFFPRDTLLWLGRGSNPDLLAPSLTQKLHYQHYHICWLLLLWKLKKKFCTRKKKWSLLLFCLQCYIFNYIFNNI